jgi:phosphopantothenoylcysteine decarboxylase/phosphopantothenate--cysteine ligase
MKKTNREPEPLALTRNADILAELAAERLREGQVVVGFAAETDDVLANGRAKLAAKKCDLLVVNEVGHGRAFDTPDNAAVILGADGTAVEVPLSSKDAVAHAVWDAVAARLTG